MFYIKSLWSSISYIYKTPLMIAITKGFSQGICALLNAKADINDEDDVSFFVLTECFNFILKEFLFLSNLGLLFIGLLNKEMHTLLIFF